MNEEQKKRMEALNALTENMEAKGYEAKVCTMTPGKANLMAVATAGPVALIAALIYFLCYSHWVVQLNAAFFITGILLLILCIPLHELIHGIAWSFGCKNGWNSIRFGMVWKELTPYCHCREGLSYGAYLLGGLMPFLVLGLLLFLLALIFGNFLLFVLSIYNILLAGGDLATIWMLRPYKKAKIINHPTACGFVAFQKKQDESRGM